MKSLSFILHLLMTIIGPHHWECWSNRSERPRAGVY